MNQTMEQYLRSYINYQQDDWLDWLPLAEFAYNNSRQATTEQSPFFLNLRYHPRFNALSTPSKVHVALNAQEHATMIQTNLDDATSKSKMSKIRKRSITMQNTSRLRFSLVIGFGYVLATFAPSAQTRNSTTSNLARLRSLKSLAPKLIALTCLRRYESILSSTSRS
jgi:hypothetical protein